MKKITSINSLLHTHEHGEGALFHLLEELGLDHQWAEFLQHILVDCVEIIILLLLVMSAVFFLQSYIDFNKLKNKLSKLHSAWGYGLAVVLGMLSPFCSCSMIPLMMGLLTMGVPLSVCLCMLTSASLLNLTALMGISSMLGSFFFWYLGGSLVLIAGSSFLVSRLSVHSLELHIDAGEKGEENEGQHHCTDGCCHDHVEGHSESLSPSKRLLKAFENALAVLRGAWIFILLGVTLSAALSSFFDMESIISFVNENGFLSVLAVALIGFPIHSDLFSMLPVLRLLLEISPVTALSFALSSMSISIPSIVLLSRILRPRTIAIYAVILLLLSVGLGWILLLL